MHDLVVRNGTVVDGTGASRRQVDVAIDEGLITALESKAGRARRGGNAEGMLVPPGGGTTVFRNWGGGFAPVRPGSEPYLINLMEGVEDIPEIVLSEGLDFRWETFGGALDVPAKSHGGRGVGSGC